VKIVHWLARVECSDSETKSGQCVRRYRIRSQGKYTHLPNTSKEIVHETLALPRVHRVEVVSYAPLNYYLLTTSFGVGLRRIWSERMRAKSPLGRSRSATPLCFSTEFCSLRVFTLHTLYPTTMPPLRSLFIMVSTQAGYETSIPYLPPLAVSDQNHSGARTMPK